jgi:fumarate reductase flavoprotein subunit
MKVLTADVVIVAAGTAGLAAAVAAAEGGAKVIVFEKASTVGGAGNMAWGPFAAESRLQRLKQIPITREEAFKIHMDYTHWRVDAQLVKAFIDKSASTIDWLEKMGVEFLEIGCHNPGFPFTWHIVKGSPINKTAGYGSAMMKVLTDRAKELGVQMFLRTPVKKILKKENRAAGVIAEDNTGEEIQANAKAVIIATGGFGDNPEMIKKYTGYELGRDLFGIRVPGVTGEGIRMAWEAGAAATPMAMELTILFAPPTDDKYVFIFHKPVLIVNTSGERFMNEEVILNPTFIGNAVSRQKKGCAFMVFDEATVEYYRQNGMDFPDDGVVALSRPNLPDAELKQLLNQEHENLFTAESLDELAVKAGIKAEAFQKTVEEYNQACDTGRDRLFGKSARYLTPVRHPKFYAAKIFPGTIGSLGGIKINYKTEVLNKEDEVISGLYAAGVDANSIYGDSYAFVLPGSTMGFAVNSGRIAGENAAQFVKDR